MERTRLGRHVQFQGDAGNWYVGRVLCNSDGIELRWMWTGVSIRLVRLHDTGDIVLVDNERLQANVPSPPLPAESESWMDALANLHDMLERDE